MCVHVRVCACVCVCVHNNMCVCMCMLESAFLLIIYTTHTQKYMCADLILLIGVYKFAFGEILGSWDLV